MGNLSRRYVHLLVLKIDKKILSYQIKKGLNKVKNFNKIFVAYEPVWSIGSGKIQSEKELFKNIVKVLNDNNIRYVIGHGNLIEYERKRPIIQDDDIDIRYDVRCIFRYMKYCKSLKNNIDIENNLVFDDRLINFKQQLNNGIQVRLHKFDSKIEYTGDIHCDLVPNKLFNQNFWIL